MGLGAKLGVFPLFFGLASLTLAGALSHARAGADELDPASVEALRLTQALLREPAKREEAIGKSPQAQLVDGQVRALVGGGTGREEIYGIAAEVMAELVKASGGDVSKMKERMARAKDDPRAFYEQLSPASRAAVEALSRKIAGAPQAAPSDAGPGAPPAQTPR